MSGARDGEYDAFVDALAAGEGYYLECAEGHGLLPPRRICPHCGDRDLTERALPETGEVVTYTTVAVPTPQFDDDAPFVTAIADFDGARVTGVLRGAGSEDVEIGQVVTADVEENATTGDRTITFRPA